MKIAIGILCTLALLGTVAAASLQSSSSPGSKGPPEVEPGKTLLGDWKGTGLAQGEVLMVDGAWVKLRITTMNKPADDNTVVMAAEDAWVNFDKLAYYKVARQKK